MFIDTVQGSLRALWPILVVSLFKFDEINKLYLIPGIIAVLLLIAAIAYLKYRNFTFFLDEDNEEFVIRKGVLNKSRIAIPIDKIQQVNINQSLIQKFIGVHALEVDTAGSSKKEVTIKAITHELAVSLKARLLEGGKLQKNIAESENEITEEKHAFIQISLLTLLKTGITSNYARSFALLLAFFITIFQYIEDFIRAAEIKDDPLDKYINTEVILKFIVFIVIAIVVLTLLVNLSRTIIKYFNFRITRQNNSLLLSYGLINTKNTIIRPEKVQIVTVGHNYFQKKFDILDIKIRQASNDEANDQNQKKSAIEIPGCNRSEKDILLDFLLGEVPQNGVILKPSIRKIIMESLKFLIIPLTLFFIVANYIFPFLIEYIIFIPIYIILAAVLIYFGFVNSRLYVNDEFIVKQSGAWDIDKDYIAPYKIQAISVKQYFWHKSSNIGIVTLYTAGGTLSFGLADYTKIKEFVNYWLYQVETTNKNWM
jgi:putative membrane protein